MRKAGIPLLKIAIFCHRWQGLVFCVLFAWWFMSGTFMMYWDYPDITAADRLARAVPLKGSDLRISPAQAYATLESSRPPDEAHLTTFDNRPAYWFRIGGGWSIVYADNGQEQLDFPADMNLRTAATWTGQPANTARLEIVKEPDQWTVAGSFQDLRPLRKYSWPDGQEVYVSEVTGQVVQFTTRGSRLGAYLGAIPHWLYFTPLRSNPELWSRLVIWLSGIGTLGALLGLVVGIARYSPSKRYRFQGNPSSVPYTGQKRLHMTLGLFFGLISCTWAFSGMLSMDPIPSQSANEARAGAFRIARFLRGSTVPLNAFENKSPTQAIAQLPSDFQLKQLKLTSFAGEPVYIAIADTNQSRIIPVDGEAKSVFDTQRIIKLISEASSPTRLAEARLITQYDAYYLDRLRKRPLPVIRVRLNDADETRYYIDPRTASVVGSYSSRGWVNRWLYHGLHSLDFPWLYNYRPAWDVVVLTLMLGGVALSVTSIIIGWQFLRKKFANSGRFAAE